MALYRIYVLDEEGHVIGPPDLVECPDDKSALAAAQMVWENDQFEVWQGDRRIFRKDED